MPNAMRRTWIARLFSSSVTTARAACTIPGPNVVLTTAGVPSTDATALAEGGVAYIYETRRTPELTAKIRAAFAANPATDSVLTDEQIKAQGWPSRIDNHCRRRACIRQGGLEVRRQAPTIAQILGLPQTDMDGKVLTGILKQEKHLPVRVPGLRNRIAVAPATFCMDQEVKSHGAAGEETHCYFDLKCRIAPLRLSDIHNK